MITSYCNDEGIQEWCWCCRYVYGHEAWEYMQNLGQIWTFKARFCYGRSYAGLVFALLHTLFSQLKCIFFLAGALINLSKRKILRTTKGICIYDIKMYRWWPKKRQQQKVHLTTISLILNPHIPCYFILPHVCCLSFSGIGANTLVSFSGSSSCWGNSLISLGSWMWIKLCSAESAGGSWATISRS